MLRRLGNQSQGWRIRISLLSEILSTKLQPTVFLSVAQRLRVVEYFVTSTNHSGFFLNSAEQPTKHINKHWLALGTLFLLLSSSDHRQAISASSELRCHFGNRRRFFLITHHSASELQIPQSLNHPIFAAVIVIDEIDKSNLVIHSVTDPLL